MSDPGMRGSEVPRESDALLWRRLARVIMEAGVVRPISLHQAARDLALSSRTLQRRLRREGITHRRVITLVRRELALDLLSKGSAKVDDVARGLGFCDARAFHRAFKRWTGLTPGEFRRRQQGQLKASHDCIGVMSRTRAPRKLV